ncbi:MAG: tetratricopeptide repeat protein [bacterium]
MAKTKKKKKSGYRSKVKITMYREADRQLVDFLMRPENRRTKAAAQSRFLDNPEKKITGDLYPYFVDWCLFDYRETDDGPTLAERFVKERPQLDEPTRDRMLGVAQRGISGFFTVARRDADDRLVLQELGAEKPGGYNVKPDVSRIPDEGSILEGRLIPWDEEWIFSSGYIRLTESGDSRFAGNLRELRQKYDTDEWRLFMAHFKPRFWQSLLKNRDIETMIKQAAQAPKATKQTLDLGHIHSLLMKDETARAIALAETRLQKDPSNREIALLLVSAYQRNKQVNEAVGLFEKVVETDPDNVQLRLECAELCTENELFERAAEILEPALAFREHPMAALVRCMLGSYYFRAGEKDRGRGIMNQAIESAPEDPRVLHQAAQTYFLGDEYAEAKKILSLRKEQGGQLIPRSSLILAHCYYFDQQWEEALDTLDSVSGHLNLPVLQRLIGDCAFQLGRYTRARNSYEEFLRSTSEEKDKDVRSVLFRLAYIEWKRGMHERALPLVRRALQGPGDHRDLVWLLVELLLERGETERAREALQILFEMDPGHPAIPSLVARLYPGQFRRPRKPVVYGAQRPWRRFRRRARRG